MTRSGHGRCEGLGPRISTRFRPGDTYEVRTAWNRRAFVHRVPTRRSVKVWASGEPSSASPEPPPLEKAAARRAEARRKRGWAGGIGPAWPRVNGRLPRRRAVLAWGVMRLEAHPTVRHVCVLDLVPRVLLCVLAPLKGPHLTWHLQPRVSCVLYVFVPCRLTGAARRRARA